jgi:Protein of unknown function (DUF4236)/Short C-terminal domain
MGLRFFRRVTLAPGVRMNLSRSGPSLSFGVRGAHLTVGSRGVRRTVGVPGTGLFYTSTTGHHTGVHSARPFTSPPRPDRAADLAAKLGDLHRAGVLTDAEYEQKRAALGPRPPPA